MYCLHCSHDLTDATDACPACDQPFDVTDPRTYAVKPSRGGPHWWRVTRTVLHSAIAAGYFAALYISVICLAVYFIVESLRRGGH